MSTSYQNIDTRLIGVEQALMFLMKSLRVREMVGSPLEANPLVRETDMFTYYREQVGKGLLEPVPEAAQEPAQETAQVDEKANG